MFHPQIQHRRNGVKIKKDHDISDFKSVAWDGTRLSTRGRCFCRNDASVLILMFHSPQATTILLSSNWWPTPTIWYVPFIHHSRPTLWRWLHLHFNDVSVRVHWWTVPPWGSCLQRTFQTNSPKVFSRWVKHTHISKILKFLSSNLFCFFNFYQWFVVNVNVKPEFERRRNLYLLSSSAVAALRWPPVEWPGFRTWPVAPAPTRTPTRPCSSGTGWVG